jgi:hypothetical protein
MASWWLPDDGATTEWGRQIATQYLERQGCDETCQALAALLTGELVRDALTKSRGPINLVIDHAATEVELRVASRPIGTADGDDDELGLLKRLAASWSSARDKDRIETWCRFACLAGRPRTCRP